MRKWFRHGPISMVSWMFVMRYCAAVLYMFVLREEAERGPKASTGGMDHMYKLHLHY